MKRSGFRKKTYEEVIELSKEKKNKIKSVLSAIHQAKKITSKTKAQQKDKGHLATMAYKKKFTEKHGYLHCERCKVNNTICWQVHHIVFRSKMPYHEMLHNPINLILLCEACHTEMHSNPNENRKLIELRNLESVFGKL